MSIVHTTVVPILGKLFYKKTKKKLLMLSKNEERDFSKALILQRIRRKGDCKAKSLNIFKRDKLNQKDETLKMFCIKHADLTTKWYKTPL